MKKNKTKWVSALLLALAVTQPGIARMETSETVPILQQTVKEVVQLPELAYSKSALAPVISEETMNFHYGKHFKAYVDQLNTLVRGTEYEQMALEDIIRKASDGALFNNAGQVFNHASYFEQLRPCGQKDTEPRGKLKETIDRSFGSFASFREKMSETAVRLFGSGWAWLVQLPDGSLQIQSYYNADNPVRHNLVPLMCIDVWEHAYYLDYQNARGNYVNQFWKLIDWDVVARRMK